MVTLKTLLENFDWFLLFIYLLKKIELKINCNIE